MAEILAENAYSYPYIPFTELKIGDTEIDLRHRSVKYQGKEVELTHMEFELLQTLIAYSNKVLSRERLLHETWGYSFAGYTRTVDVHIWKLRRKLHLENQIKTVYKAGYCLDLNA